MRPGEMLAAMALSGLLYPTSGHRGRGFCSLYDCNGDMNDNEVDRYIQIHRKHNLTCKMGGKIRHEAQP